MNAHSLALAMPGTQPGFDELVYEHFNQVLSFVHRLVGDIAVSHRITEASFREAARYYRRGKAPGEPRSLVFFLATTRAREFLRKGDRQSLLSRLIHRHDGPLVEFGEDDCRALVTDTSQRALSTLEWNDRVVLLLHDYCGLSYAEVARAAGMGKSAVPRDLDRARHDFKQAYDYIKF
ncbi:MAG: RNA polymerase sigma factor [Candidatus Dormibacteria bacterium]